MNLKHIRNYYGLSQKSLAQLLGVSRSYVAQIEGNYCDISEPVERQARALFDVKAAEKDALERKARAYHLVPD
ncbi:helix-turn-helix transcriptional regulator [Rummeliibacillus sp. SL167]|uniref:helix-turn-helix domain-containing protein n=1 Tax=Rummeliibacillus sp. SL167 TaxID=2579792 RepID=UPI0011B6D82C|nr:helix-turn-helix transcriptional regulator [Rummeliibacillus sp. SL167]